MTHALSISKLSKRYATGTQALDEVTLHVDQGDFFALLGPNGAGKSTLIGVISSLITKDSGSVKIFDHDIDTDFNKAKQQIGIVPQEFNFNAFEKTEDILINQAGYYGLNRDAAKEASERYLDKLGLWSKRGDASRFLSGGMKRRLMIARALVHKPSLLVLDEPTAGVDIELRRTMWQFLEEINAEGTTIILTTHYLEEAESLCRNVAIINQGQVVERANMQSLLSGLQRETFILDLDRDSSSVELDSSFAAFALDNNRLEVSLDKGTKLNSVIKSLDEQGVAVLSMRNKVNRLEELFVDLVANQKGGES